jgi:hypothetical protein
MFLNLPGGSSQSVNWSRCPRSPAAAQTLVRAARGCRSECRKPCLCSGLRSYLMRNSVFIGRLLTERNSHKGVLDRDRATLQPLARVRSRSPTLLTARCGVVLCVVGMGCGCSVRNE